MGVVQGAGGEDDPGTQGRRKKSLESALLEIARTGRTTDERLVSIFRAQKVNRVLGGLAVMPWDVGTLNDEWLDAFSALVDELPRAQAMVKAQEKSQSDWLKKQSYRGYLKGKK